MPNTLDKFYNYTADALFQFFSNTQPITAGDRYFIHFENELDIAVCFREMIEKYPQKVHDFTYRFSEDAKEYNSKFIFFGDVKLIIATNKNATSNYLTLLRNMVSVQDNQFLGTAILILFSGQLDSLLEGCSDLTKTGMPLSFDHFNADINKRIDHVFAQQIDKRIILESAIKSKMGEFRSDDLSIFDFNNIIAIVQSENFEKQDYQLLGMFPHFELTTIRDQGNIKFEMGENNKHFETIEYAVNYGNLHSDLAKMFTPAGIEKIESGLADSSWKLIDYAELKKYFLKPDIAKPVEYKGLSEDIFSSHIKAWSRKDEKNKRLFHILLFNDTSKYPYTQELNFNGVLKGELKILNANSELVAVEKIGKSISIKINGPLYNENTLSLEYTDHKVQNVKYRFRIWVINGNIDFLEEYEAKYIISDEGELQLSNENSLHFNKGIDETEYVDLQLGKTYNLTPECGLKINIKSDDDDVLAFFLNYNSQQLSLLAKQVVGSLSPIKGWEVWQDKRHLQKSFKYSYSEESDALKIISVNEESVPTGRFRKDLLLEIQMMEQPELAWFQSDLDKLSPRQLKLSDKMLQAYYAYVDKISAAGTLPSLFFVDEETQKFAQDYVDAFIFEVNSIGEDNILDEQTKADLILLGTVSESADSKVVKLSPLHPLMVAYQLEIYRQIGQEVLYEAMLKKFTPLYLLPYFYWKNDKGERRLYASKENNHSPEWQVYSSDLQFKQFAGREFIRDLVNEKIHEFVINFAFLFSYDLRTPIKVNVYNMGECLQVLQGIFDYYKDRVMAGTSLFDLRPIELFLYGSEKFVTTFEKMSHLIVREDIVDNFEISTNSRRVDFDDLINAFRSKVKYFAIAEQGDTHYAHLTFYQFDKKHTGITSRDHSKIPTGLSLRGLLNDLPSYYHDSTYVTGFGTRFSEMDTPLIKIALAYNSLGKVAFSKDTFENQKVLCTTIDNEIKSDLNILYAHSQWVVFVDPQFDLSFFKDENDLIMVHYSDQYSNASGFDAITVSSKSNQYFTMLNTILLGHGVTTEKADILRVIDLFNAINGQWLIKMIGRKDENNRKEKISIPAALKIFLSYFDHPDIIWIPISLEEILRVSGGAGLSKSEGLFSTANLGVKKEHSDDLLMIGLFEKDGVLHVQFYPVEVKIGINNSTVIEKARTQALKTYNLIYDRLSPGNLFEAKFYRIFFAKLAIINAGKMDLYEIWQEKNWSVVFDTYRDRLMNDDFVITKSLSQFINKYAIIAFTQSPPERSYLVEDEGVRITLFEDDAYSDLVRGVPEIKRILFDNPYSVRKEKLLFNQLKDMSQLTHETIYPSEEKKNADSEPEYEVQEGSYVIDEESTEVDQISLPMEILIGNNTKDGKPVYWYPTDTGKVMHTNTGIIGTMGTGKTQFTKSLITQLNRSGPTNVEEKEIGILIFDYKGDYINPEFTKATGAKIYQLHNLPYNPLAIDVTENSMPLLPLHIASTLQETISKAFNLGNKQKAVLKETIMAAYEEKGIYKGINETWTKIAPTISDVCELYLENEKVAIDSLHAALKQLHDFEIFQPDGNKTKSLFELIEGVTVINLSGYSPDIQNLVVAITLDAFYSQMQKNGHSKISGNFRQITKMILVDEADNFLSKNFTSLRKILKEGREFGVGTILSTQFLNHFSTGDNEYDQYILTWIIHRVSDVKLKDLDTLFSIKEKDQKEYLVQRIKGLEKHFSVVSLGGSSPIIIEDMPFWKLMQ